MVCPRIVFLLIALLSCSLLSLQIQNNLNALLRDQSRAIAGLRMESKTVSSSLEDSDQHLELPTDIVTVVVAHCKENINYLNQFGCQHFRFVVMSKCGEPVPPLTNIANCTTTQSIKNCGTQEYAYFKFVADNYDNLPPMVAFIQGGALTENPHVRHDMTHYIPGTLYADLSRHVRGTWHMVKDPIRDLMMKRVVAPQTFNVRTWMINWRSQFMASRTALRRIPLDFYHELNKKSCSKACQEINCGTEIWFSPMFGCSDIVFQGNDCQTHVHHITAKTIPEDHLKDDFGNGVLAWTTNQTTCGNATLLLSPSAVNGRIICVEQPIARSTQWWRTAIYEIYAERHVPNLDGMEWRWDKKCETKEVKKPAWHEHDENSKRALNVSSS